jgi:acetylornithine/N-succinyldiaminopimelate aminotransferase
VISAVMPTYARADVVFERGEGAYLIDTSGRRYLDFSTGVAVNALGHAHPRLIRALTEQAGKLWHISNWFRIVGQERVAERLIRHSFADTVFFANSGAEAWECGVKLIRKHFYEKGESRRNRIVTAAAGFHGRTMAAISAAKQEKLVKGFGPLLDGFDQVAYGNLNEMRAAITPETAAICVEPIQGEGGVREGGAEYLRGLRAIADEFGLLLYFDEVQTGIGRTGKLFAYEWAGIAPDVMCLAKGLGGGFPVGACLATEKAASGMVAGTHGSTFGGNPLAMAVAAEVLDVITEPGFLERVQAMAGRLQQALVPLLERHPKVYAEIRGTGLLLGLRCLPTNSTIVDALRSQGLLTVAASDNVVRLLPPLIIGPDEIAAAVDILDRTAALVEAGGVV